MIYMLREHVAILGRMLAQTPAPPRETLARPLARINEIFEAVN